MLPSNRIDAITFDKLGNKYLATSKGLVKISSKNEWTIFNSTNTDMKSEYILALAIDSQNNLWFTNGSWVDPSSGLLKPGSLIQYNGTNFYYYPLPGPGDGKSIAISSHDSVWVGRGQVYQSRENIGGGLVKYKGNGQFTAYASPDLTTNSINEIAFNSGDTLFIARGYQTTGIDYGAIPGGLSYYYGGKIFNFDSTNSPLSYNKFESILTIFVDSSDNIYLSGGLNSVFVYNPNGIISSINDYSAKDFNLDQNYPNPFNPVTKINYNVFRNSKVNLTVYDLLGNKISVLVDEYKNAGIYTIRFDGSNLPSGIYFYKITNEEYVETKKMVLLR